MAKMYYNEQEAADKLQVDVDELLNMVRNGELRAYADGTNRMFKVTDVDQIADTKTVDSGESDIQLSPVEMSGTHAPISLSDTEDTAITMSSDTGSDTVITSEGISIFDDDELDDLDIEPADPMAKTQIAPSLEEGIGIEAPSSGGSGLLDLTRESDDTSLGDDVLGNIDMESGEMASLDEAAPSEGLTEQAQQAVAAAPAFDIAEAAPVSGGGAFAGLAFSAFVVAIICCIMGLGAMSGGVNPLASMLGSKLFIYLGSAAGLVLISAIVGKFAGPKG